MRFVEIINKRKFTLISLILCLYVLLNLFDGERGLISYFEKQKIKKQLIEKKETLILRVGTLENKNNLLTDNIDLDYLETLYRKKFMLGKPNEKIFAE
tara:strand:+ start:301 stop:594 length:294 start_codon:yes stop_codon:yes gene_type:complete